MIENQLDDAADKVERLKEERDREKYELELRERKRKEEIEKQRNAEKEMMHELQK